MPVKVTDFEIWEYVHDDAPSGSHGGTLDPSTVAYGKNIDGTDNLNLIIVPCPFEGCGFVSCWPPGGGADALLGQSLHVVLQYQQPGVASRGTPLDVTDAADQVKQRVIVMDGEERWVLDDSLIAALTGKLVG